jgi:heme/copper-type cytochrome/quinol oxidase subunit 2
VWGNIITEAIVQTNFNVSFANSKTDSLIHLSQWQYWWWFWFTFLWAFYYLTILRVVRFRTLKFRPRLATTQRPHGKWGDLLICIIPVSWCANILSNSSFILRMIEWQAESGLFTVRIRGKQWYWIYKFELKTFTDILTTPKSIGRDKWAIYTPGDVNVANDYLHALQLRSQNKWVKKYWNKYLLDSSTPQNTNLLSAAEFLRSNFKKNAERINRDIKLNNASNSLKHSTKDYPIDFDFNFKSDRLLIKDSSLQNLFVRAFNKKKSVNSLNPQILENDLFKDIDLNVFSTDLITNFTRQQQVYQNTWLLNSIEKALDFNSKSPEVTYYKYSDYNTMSRWVKKPTGVASSARIIKLDLNESSDAFDIRFSNPEVTTHQKIAPHSTFLTMKQKRYARKKAILPRTIFFRDDDGLKMKKKKFSGKLALKNNQVIDQVYSDANKQYRFFRKNKKRYENTSILLSKRMLRTRRTLVLPAHVNLTAITNSYDVIHSWFIPGLGLKMDCIPGRSTHHTFYIDNVGFYYGQCAEVCGRYHHHMPIRICALPFEHFLVWWHSFGLPKLLSTRRKKRLETYYANRKYVW